MSHADFESLADKYRQRIGVLRREGERVYYLVDDGETVEGDLDYLCRYLDVLSELEPEPAIEPPDGGNSITMPVNSGKSGLTKAQMMTRMRDLRAANGLVRREVWIHHSRTLKELREALRPLTRRKKRPPS